MRRPKVIPIHTPSGLPDDYADLTEEGRRQARVNASRQWLLSGTPQERAANLVRSIAFFDRYYLWPDIDVDFDPMFYDMDPLPTPAMHHDIYRMWGANRLNLVVAPRGSAKSTLERKDRILRMVSCPMYTFIYATSTSENAAASGQAVKDQCYENGRINADFGPEYGVTSLKPRRGIKPTGVEQFFLNNGSYSRQISASSRFRGGRPRRFRLDDPEYDSSASTSMQTLRDYMERLITKLILPSISRPNTGCDWTATFVSQRHYAWHAMELVRDPATGETQAADPRFNFWGRLLIKAARRDESTGRIVSCWPEMWPATVEEKRELGLSEDHVSLEEQELTMGSAAFAAEMMGEPGTAGDSYFNIDLDPKGTHAYWFTEVDPELATNPYASQTKINWRRGDETITMPLSKFLSESWLFIAVDSAYTVSTHSDRRVCNLMAVNSENELFVLHMWSARVHDSELIEHTFSTADLWGCRVIWVETVKETLKLYHSFVSAVSTRVSKLMGAEKPLAIRRYNPGMASKTSKIASLDIRVEHNLIKLPLWQRSSNPAIARLVEQFISFNPEVDDGGLQHDDEIDTCSMSLHIVKGRVRERVAREVESKKSTVLERLAAGETDDAESRLPLMHGVDLTSIPMSTLNELIANSEKRNAARDTVV